MSNRVPIRGIGVVAPGAIGVEAFRAFLGRGSTAVAEVTRFDTIGLRAHRAALVEHFTPREFIPVMKMRRMNGLSRLVVAASRMAIEDAGGLGEGNGGVAIGTAFGPVQTSVDYMSEYVARGPALAPPQLFAESVANAPGSHVAIEWRLRGFNMTVTQRESSALAAAMYAAMQIIKGSVDTAIIGGVEEANEMLFSVLDRVGALAHGADEASRPFDRRRNGMVLGEGSAVLVAGGDPSDAYGFLSGFGMARDQSATLSDWGNDPQALVEAMGAALEDAELEIGDIDAVYASANSSIRGDRVEHPAIATMFGGDVPVVATKGYFGEYAAAGALQLVAALLAIDSQTLHASCGFEEGDPDLRIDVVREARPAVLRHVLVNSLSAGGGIFSCVVSKEAA